MRFSCYAILILFTLITAPISQAQDSTLAADVDSILEYYAGADDPGVVLLVSTSDGTQIAARGLADLEAGIPVKTSDRFRIGSITKTFVATIVLQLAEEEALALDDAMADYLPAEVAENIEYGDEITIRQLMNMTSGIPDYLESEAFYEVIANTPDYPWTAAETVTYAYDLEAYFPPGEGYAYSNTNYNLLQMIIESVTGSTLAQELQVRIFKPLGMDDSVLESPAALGQGIAHGYADWDGDGVLDDVTFVNEGNGLGDGGIISTADDLAIFARALFKGELLDPDSMSEMMDFVADGEGGLYGLGVAMYEGDFGTELGHSGATAGFQSNMVYLPESDVVVVVLTNNFNSEIIVDLTYDAETAAVESLD